MLQVAVKKKQIQDNILILLIWGVLICAHPFIFYNILGINYILILMPAVLTLLIYCLLLKSYKCNKTLYILISIQFLFWSIQIGFRSDFAYVSNLIQVFILILLLCSTNLLHSKDLLFKSYINFLKWMVILGTVTSIVLMFVNIEPIITYQNHDNRNGYSWILTCTNTFYQFGSTRIIRYAGFFDEPGTLCFFVLYALLINKLLYQDKKTENILLFCPLMTFSIAHLILSSCYILFFKLKKIKHIIVTIIIGLIVVFTINSTKGTPYYRVYQMTLGRLEITEDGIAGNNRAHLQDLAVEHFQDALLFGKGKSYFEENNIFVGDNIAFVGAYYGIVGYPFIFLLFLYAFYLSLFNHGKFKFSPLIFKLNILLLMTYMQRPSVTNVMQSFSLLLYVFAIIEFKKRITHENTSY